jgi:hypothetical protein
MADTGAVHLRARTGWLRVPRPDVRHLAARVCSNCGSGSNVIANVLSARIGALRREKLGLGYATQLQQIVGRHGVRHNGIAVFEPAAGGWRLVGSTRQLEQTESGVAGRNRVHGAHLLDDIAYRGVKVDLFAFDNALLFVLYSND